MKKKARDQQKPISLDGFRHDEIDRTAALAVLTISVANTQAKLKKEDLFISIDAVKEAVQEFFEQLRVSMSDINRRIERWMDQGWVTKTKVNNQFLVTDKGILYLNLLASAA